MSSLWHPYPKEAPLQGLTGMWGGNSSALVGASGPITQGTISELYAAANEPGIQTVVLNDGSSTRSLNFDRWSDKGWVEIMFCGNVPYGYHQQAGFYKSIGGGYGLQTFNENATATGLNYTNAGSQITLGNNITTTDILFTTKSSRSLAQINPPTGENQNSNYPLRMSASIGGAGTQQSSTKTAMLQYFRGERKGFTFYQTAGTNADTFSAYWDKGGLSFGMLLHSRDGSPQLDHWYVASGNTNSGGTYYANIGFRDGNSGGSYASKYTGAWNDHTSVTSSTYLMANDNVFSVWVTDM